MIRTHVVANGLKPACWNNKLYGGAKILKKNMYGTLPRDPHNRTCVLLNWAMCSLHHNCILRGDMNIIERHVSQPLRDIDGNNNSVLDVLTYWEQARIVGDIGYNAGNACEMGQRELLKVIQEHTDAFRTMAPRHVNEMR